MRARIPPGVVEPEQGSMSRNTTAFEEASNPQLSVPKPPPNSNRELTSSGARPETLAGLSGMGPEPRELGFQTARDRYCITEGQILIANFNSQPRLMMRFCKAEGPR